MQKKNENADTAVSTEDTPVEPITRIITDEELHRWHKHARRKAISFTRKNGYVAGLNIAQLMTAQIRQTGWTCEDIIQELWTTAINALCNSTSTNEKEIVTFVMNAVDWRINALAAEMFSNKRGNKDPHDGSDDSNNLFNGNKIYEE